MSDAKHTQGPYEAICTRIENYPQRLVEWEVQRGTEESICVLDGEDAEKQAALISEAFNVAYETGLTPRQLADRWQTAQAMAVEALAHRNELLAALKAQELAENLQRSYDEGAFDVPVEDRIEAMERAAELRRAIIAKAECQQ